MSACRGQADFGSKAQGCRLLTQSGPRGDLSRGQCQVRPPAFTLTAEGRRPETFDGVGCDAVDGTPEFDAIGDEVDQNNVGIGWATWMPFKGGRAPDGL